MSTVTIHLTGPSVWVPHEDEPALLGILPNGTHLGSSPRVAYQQLPLARHWPVFWEESYDVDGNQSLSFPEEFLGSRLVFRFFGRDVDPPGLDLSEIRPIARNGWLDVASRFLDAAHNDKMAAQVLLQQGKVEIYDRGTCPAQWSDASSPWSTDTIPKGLTVTVKNVERIEVEAVSYIDQLDNKPIYYRNTCDADKNPILWVGNVCAESIAEWDRNSKDDKILDRDFYWIYGLTASLEEAAKSGTELPVPVVEGSDFEDDTSPEEAFKLLRDGGGNVGCECRICIDKPRRFSYP